MKIEEKIRELIEQTGVTCVFDRWNRVNLELDQSTFPVGIMQMPVAGAINVKNGMRTTSYDVFVYFADIIPYDATAQQHADVIHSSLDRCYKFLALTGKYFAPVPSPVRFRCLYDVTDVNVTGVSMELTLTELDKVCLT